MRTIDPMRKIGPLQRMFVGFVIVTILAMLCAPSMMPMNLTNLADQPTRAGANVTTGAVAELCTTGDFQRPSSALRGGGKPAPDDCQGHGGHCMFCSAAVDPVVPTIPPPVLHRFAAGLAYLPAIFTHGPRTLFAWAPSQARAPPAILVG
jgi:Protein of unknown function (DUF2946)